MATAVPDRARLVRVALGCDARPVDAARALRADRAPFALSGAWAGGGAIVGSEPLVVAGAGVDPLALLDRQPAVEGAVPGAFGGGWVGYLGYRLGGRLEATWPDPPGSGALPPFALAFYDHVLRLDTHGRWWFEALQTPGRAAALDARRELLERRLADPPVTAPVRTGPWRAVPAAAGHARAVQAVRELIAAGDVFQVNLCARLEAPLSGDPLELWAAGIEHLDPPRAAWLTDGWGAIASLSPELFLERHGDRVVSAPIKGTAPLGAGAGAALAASAKDRAENTMIVDLVRNDLGRVCTYGSVGVRALAEPRVLAGVWHLVSEVEGRLPPGTGDGELVGAAFPPGSVTGAPKVRAMEVISALESVAREAYTGAIGFASPVAGLELSVAIRTFEARGDRVWLGVGGGVVHDSDPQAEAAEAAAKAAPLLAAIRADPPPTEPPPPASTDDSFSSAMHQSSLDVLARVGRPDPALGVFETLLVVDGRPQRLDDHVARLGASVAALYGAALPADLRGRVEARAAAHPAGRHRLRIDAVPGPADDLVFRVDTGPAPPPAERPLDLAITTLPGGLGAHKWRDRRLLDRLRAERPDGDALLLVDLEGEVLEADRAAIVIREAGELIAPPHDGRILPSIGRLALPGVREEPIALDRLSDADEILVVNALRGAERAVLPRSGSPRGGTSARARARTAAPGPARP